MNPLTYYRAWSARMRHSYRMQDAELYTKCLTELPNPLWMNSLKNKYPSEVEAITNLNREFGKDYE